MSFANSEPHSNNQASNKTSTQTPTQTFKPNGSLLTGLLTSSLLLTACAGQMSESQITNNSQHIGQVTSNANIAQPFNKVVFNPAGSYVHGAFDESAAEITAFHPRTKRSFVVNAENKKVDVIDLTDIHKPVFISSLDVSDIGSVVNSVAVHGDKIALAVQANIKTDNGHVAIFDANTLQRTGIIEVGALPDMVTFTHDGHYLLVANEGEPDEDYKVDAAGSISIINLQNMRKPNVKTATFNKFNGQKQQLVNAGVRIFGQKADGTMSTVAEDLEPEYIAVNKEGTTAYVSLQENNAIAVVDIASAQVTAIKPLGAKDHSRVGNELDVSNKDDAINITTWPIMGMYMPDAIAYYSVNGKDYIVTANEGDAREWGDFNEEVGFNDIKTDPTKFNTQACHNLKCGDKKALGKIDFSASMGDSNGDGVYEALYSFGARSFSIWDVANMSSPVFDSGSFMGKYTAQKYPNNFNASNDKNSFDNRSDNKGAEPEGVTIGQVGSQTVAFIGLERISSVMAFDVTNPKAVKFLGEINTRSFDNNKLEAVKKGSAPANADGDLGPEGLTFIAAKDSPSGKPLLLVGFEVSGTSRVFELDFL